MISLAFGMRRNTQLRKRILIINGHPDPRPGRFCSALCRAYRMGSDSRGLETRQLDVGAVAAESDSPSAREALSRTMAAAIGDIRWANWLVVVFPLWFNKAPPSLQQLFQTYSRVAAEQTADDAIDASSSPRTARLMITMSMPGLLLRPRLFRKPRAIDESIDLCLTNIEAQQVTLIGNVDYLTTENKLRWLNTAQGLGARGI